MINSILKISFLVSFIFLTLHGRSQSSNAQKVVIPISEIQKGKTQVIKISTVGLDSVALIFPSGGTQTSVALYKTKNSDDFIKIIGFQDEDGESNRMMLYKSEVGKYYIKFHSCHWGKIFRLLIE